MGVRARRRRDNRRRMKARMRRRRREGLALARPRCPACSARLAREIPEDEIWACLRCGGTYLRQGAELLPEMRLPEPALPGEGLRRAA
jgi:ribosomal protein L37AE/L43A